jgi:hypothetical protein
MRLGARTSLSLAVALIVTVAPGCDNVRWEGTDIAVVPPPPPVVSVSDGPTTDQAAAMGLPAGRILFHLLQTADGMRLVPIGEVSGDSLRTLRKPAEVAQEAYSSRFQETVLTVGAQFDVFHRGANVGTFTVQAPGPLTPCGIPTATGHATVVAAAVDAPQFLAFRRGLSPEVRTEFNPPQMTGSIRTYASIVAERLILQAGLARPRSWPGAQRRLEAVEVARGANPEMAATYLVGDSLAVGPADAQGYSLFYLAEYETRRGYEPIYAESRDYRRTGKAAPALVDYLDWNEDGQDELLVRVFGRNQAWYEVVAKVGDSWRKVWEGGGC